MFILVEERLSVHQLEVMFRVYARECPPEPGLDLEGIAEWISGAPEEWKIGFDRLAGVNSALADQWVFHCLEETEHFICHPFDGSILQIEVSA